MNPKKNETFRNPKRNSLTPGSYWTAADFDSLTHSTLLTKAQDTNEFGTLSRNVCLCATKPYRHYITSSDPHPVTFYSDILSDMYSNIQPCILSDINSDILSSILSGIISDVYSDILSGILSDIYSDIPPGILFDIKLDILADIPSGILTYIQTFFLASYLTYILTFFLAL